MSRIVLKRCTLPSLTHTIRYGRKRIARHRKHYIVIILTRDAMRKRGLCCRPVSVRLSVRHVGALYPDG